MKATELLRKIANSTGTHLVTAEREGGGGEICINTAFITSIEPKNPTSTVIKLLDQKSITVQGSVMDVLELLGAHV